MQQPAQNKTKALLTVRAERPTPSLTQRRDSYRAFCGENTEFLSGAVECSDWRRSAKQREMRNMVSRGVKVIDNQWLQGMAGPPQGLAGPNLKHVQTPSTPISQTKRPVVRRSAWTHFFLMCFISSNIRLKCSRPSRLPVACTPDRTDPFWSIRPHRCTVNSDTAIVYAINMERSSLWQSPSQNLLTYVDYINTNIVWRIRIETLLYASESTDLQITRKTFYDHKLLLIDPKLSPEFC